MVRSQSPAPARPDGSESPEISSTAKLQGRLLIVIAALMWSTSGFFAKANVWESWPRDQQGPLLAFWRAFFASVVLVLLVRRPRWSPKLIPMVVVFAIMNLTFLTAMAKGDATNAIWLQYTAPVWVFLVGVFYFGERVVPRDWTMLIVCTAGVGVILYFGLQTSDPVAIGTGLLSGVFFAGVVLCIRQLRDFESAWLIALNHLVTAGLLAPYAIYQGVWPSGSQWIYLACFGIFQIGLPYVLFAKGLQRVTGHEASCISLLEPVLVPVWVYLAWDQSPELTTLVGGAMILTGLLARYWPAKEDGMERTSNDDAAT